MHLEYTKESIEKVLKNMSITARRELLDLLIMGAMRKSFVSKELLKVAKNIGWIKKKKHTLNIIGWFWPLMCDAVFSTFTEDDISGSVRSMAMILGVQMTDHLEETVRNMRDGISLFETLKILLQVDKVEPEEDALLIPSLKEGYSGALGSIRSRIFTALFINFDVDEYEGFTISEFLVTVGVGLFILYNFKKVALTERPAELQMTEMEYQRRYILSILASDDIMAHKTT
jgi:hypothetical protein